MKGEQFWLPGLKPEQGPILPKNKPDGRIIGGEEDYMDTADFIDDKKMVMDEEPIEEAPKPEKTTAKNFLIPSYEDDQNDAREDIDAIVAARRFQGQGNRFPRSKTITPRRKSA